VIIEGRAPIWRYGMALHKLHPSPAAAIAFYDPRLGAVVVATHSHAVAGGPDGGCDATCGEIAALDWICGHACSSTEPGWRILALL